MPEAKLENLRLFYTDQGRGEPLVLLHGLGSSSRDWEYQYPDFTRQHRVIAPDLRGFGKTSRPANGRFSIAGFAEDVWNLLDQLGIEHFSLLGYSMGGATAFEMAATRPSRIRKLIIVNCPPSFEVKNLSNLFELYMRLGVVRLLGMSKMAQVIGRRLFPRDDQSELREQFIERYSENDTSAYLSTVRALAGWSVVKRLPQITCPTLLISADNDYTPLSQKEAAIAELPDGKLQVISNSRHGTPIDQPEAFNRAVLGFLAN